MLSSVAQLLKRVDEILATGLPKEAAPLAALDADGTLWDGDLGEEAFRSGFSAGVIRSSVVKGELHAWADTWGIAFDGDADDAEAWFAQLAAACEGDRILAYAPEPWDEHLARKNLYAMQSWAYAGGTSAEIRAYGARLFAESYQNRIFSWWPALLDGLRARGISIVVVSGTHPDLLVPGVQSLGIAEEDVFGSKPTIDTQGRFQPSPQCALYGERKEKQVAQICQERFGARYPILAFGDSVENTDRQMLEMASMAVAVRPRGKHLAGAERRGYWVFTESVTT